MATYYSNQFAAAGTDVTAFDSSYRASQGAAGGVVKKEIARLTTAGTSAADVLRMFRGLHSSTRVFSITAQSASTPSAGTADVGIYLSDIEHDGAEVDDNVFEDAQSLTSGLAEADVFTGASLTALDRGKTLWELAGLSADPNVLYDICITTDTGITTASAVEIMMVAEILLTD